jgi:hypothetical protein
MFVVGAVDRVLGWGEGKGGIGRTFTIRIGYG